MSNEDRLETKGGMTADDFFETLAGRLTLSDAQIATLLAGLNADTLRRLSEQTKREVCRRSVIDDGRTPSRGPPEAGISHNWPGGSK
jgi:hypothetical protein